MRARAAASILVMVTAFTACGSVPTPHSTTPIAEPMFSVHRLPPSPSPLRIEVDSGDVRGLIPDGWDAQPLPSARYPQQGFVASPQLKVWNEGPGTVGGMEAFWIDIAKLSIPSDYYYMVARGPAIASLASNEDCHPATRQVVVDNPPDFTGATSSTGDYVVSATGSCRTKGTPTRWAYIVAAPGFGPIRQVGIPTSGLYVVVAVVSGKKAKALLGELMEAARFGNTPIGQIVQAARTTS